MASHDLCGLFAMKAGCVVAVVFTRQEPCPEFWKILEILWSPETLTTQDLPILRAVATTHTTGKQKLKYSKQNAGKIVKQAPSLVPNKNAHLGDQKSHDFHEKVDESG